MATNVRTAPTEAEIRAWVVGHGAVDNPDGLFTRFQNLVDEWADGLSCAAFDTLESQDPRSPKAVAPGAWRDLRPSEAIVLRDFVRTARDRIADKAKDVIIDELTAAGVDFAEEFPNAPWTPLGAPRKPQVSAA